MLLNLTLMLLFGLIFIFSSGTFVSSCIYKAVGDTVVIQLGTEELQEDSHLTWTHNKKRVYLKKGSNVRIRDLTVDRCGSLILENIQKNQTGDYKGEMFNEHGKLIKKTEEQLCVQEPVPEPTVMVECVEKGVDLTCSPVNSGDVAVSWMKNGDKSNTTHAVLHVSSPELKSGDTFSCTLNNRISTKSAKDVQPVCSDTGLHATTASEDEEKKEKEENSKDKNKKDDVTEKKLLFGFDLWWMLVILTGGASLLLILIVICIVCVCRRRNKRKAKEEAEFRLVSLMPDYTDQPDVPYMQKSESQRPSKSLRPLPPLPSSRGPPAVQPQQNHLAFPRL